MKVIYLLILGVSFAWAGDYTVAQKDCSPTDIRDHHPHLKEHFSNPQDQDSIGWCFGFTAADLLSVEAKEPVSAIHVSTIFNKKVAQSTLWSIGYGIGEIFQKGKFDEVYEGGFIKSAIKDAMKNKKVCSDKDLPFYTEHSVEMRWLIHTLENIRKMIKENKVSEELACQTIEQRIGLSIFGGNYDKEKVIVSILNDDLNVAIEKLVSSNCRERMISLETKKVRELHRPSRVQDKDRSRTYPQEVRMYKQKVNDLLSKGKPLGIVYNVKHVTNSSGLHANSVIARRWNNGRCEYKIRNSWGRSCSSYKKEIECDFNEGSFWVSDEKFFKMADSLTFIDS